MAYTLPTVEEQIAAAREVAIARGLDPDKFVRALKTEGLGSGIWQSNAKNAAGLREPSYGLMQMLKGGKGTGFPVGMGNQFEKDTGLDVTNPANWRTMLEYGANQFVKDGGWKQWYGPRDNGLPMDYALTANAKVVPITLGGGRQVLDQAAAETPQTPVDGQAPALPAPVNVEGTAVSPSATPSTLGDRLGSTIFGDELAAKLKSLSAPATDATKAGPLSTGNLTSLANAFTGKSSEMHQRAVAEAHAPIQSLIPGVESEQTARMASAQKMMAALLAAKKQSVPGMTLGGGLNMGMFG